MSNFIGRVHQHFGQIPLGNVVLWLRTSFGPFSKAANVHSHSSLLLRRKDLHEVPLIGGEPRGVISINHCQIRGSYLKINCGRSLWGLIF